MFYYYFYPQFFNNFTPRYDIIIVTKNMKDALILQDKKYISAKRAAVIFGYSSDYVGQLCREGKIECTMVGRSWFVSEESVLKHKVSSSDAKISSDDSVKIVSVPVKANVDSIFSGTTESLLSSGKSIKDFVLEPTSVSNSKSSIDSLPLSATNVLSTLSQASTLPKPSTNLIRTQENVIRDFPKQSKSIASNIVIRRKENNKFDLSLVLILLLLSVVLLGKNFISYFPYSSNEIVATVLNGVVVAPSVSTSLENESIKNDLRNPFSDEVTIKPDESGTSGVIVPVFKESKGDDFLYVMVPVKESKKDENK
jgi:hypothetical protein